MCNVHVIGWAFEAILWWAQSAFIITAQRDQMIVLSAIPTSALFHMALRSTPSCSFNLWLLLAAGTYVIRMNIFAGPDIRASRVRIATT